MRRRLTTPLPLRLGRPIWWLLGFLSGIATVLGLMALIRLNNE